MALCTWQGGGDVPSRFMTLLAFPNSTLSLFPPFSPVDIREIRELRLGKASRDFERYPEEARKVDASHCFIVVYGLEFRLKTLSVAGQCSEPSAVTFHHLPPRL